MDSLDSEKVGSRFRVAARKLGRWATSPYRALRGLCLAVGVAVVVGAFGTVAAGYLFLRSLPVIHSMNMAKLKELTQKRLASRYEDGKRRRPAWVPLAEVRRDCLYAIVMSEDSTFFEHDGVNFDAMAAAALINLKKGAYEAGASTISQQVVKNLFLSGERTITRKLKELILTMDLESRFTKNQILEAYLNLVEVGPDLYGVAEAARHYFRKEPSEINAAEGAFIALMLPSPRKYHYSIFENRNLSLRHRRKLRRVLGDMHATELISPEKYREYVSYDYFPKPSSASTDRERAPAGRSGRRR